MVQKTNAMPHTLKQYYHLTPLKKKKKRRGRRTASYTEPPAAGSKQPRSQDVCRGSVANLGVGGESHGIDNDLVR